MKLDNGFWEDERGNRWSADLCSEEEALKYSATLTACSSCQNCNDCSYCRDCSGCRDCNGCINCSRCNSCFNCVGCSDCSRCNSCFNCVECIDCSYCRGCSDCRDCNYCKDCSYCNSFEDNPQRVIGKRIGSRDDYPSVYWIEAGKEQCVVGCFRGTLDELEKAVEKTHKDSPKYLEQYRKFIKAVRAYQGVMK